MRSAAVALACASVLLAVAGSAFAEPARGPMPEPLTAEDLGEAPVTFHLGRGEPASTVIYMHGLGGDPRHSDDFVRKLLTPAEGSPAVRVVAIWMRPRQGLHTMSDQLARARKAIDAEPGPVTLMGHSFGGKAALKLATEYPENKVKNVVALAPSVNMLQSYWKRITGERELPAPEVVEAKLAEVQKVLARNLAVAQARGERKQIKEAAGELTYFQTMKDLAKHDEPGFERNVKRPTLVLHGTEDGAVSIHYARRFAAANPGAVEIVELPGADHGFELEAERKLEPSKRSDILSTMMKKPVQDFLAKQAPPRAAAAAQAVRAPAAPAAPAAPEVPRPKVGFFGRVFGK